MFGGSDGHVHWPTQGKATRMDRGEGKRRAHLMLPTPHLGSQLIWRFRTWSPPHTASLPMTPSSCQFSTTLTLCSAGLCLWRELITYVSRGEKLFWNRYQIHWRKTWFAFSWLPQSKSLHPGVVGWILYPRNLYVKELIPSTSEGDYVWS